MDVSSDTTGQGEPYRGAHRVEVGHPLRGVWGVVGVAIGVACEAHVGWWGVVMEGGTVGYGIGAGWLGHFQGG